MALALAMRRRWKVERRELAQTNGSKKLAATTCNYLQSPASALQLEGSNFQPPGALWIGADCSGLVRIAAVGATSIRSNPELEFRSAPVYSGLLWIRVAVGSAEQKKKRNSRSVKIGRVWSSLRKITQH